VVGYKELSERDYEGIVAEIQKAKQALSSDREEQVALTYERVEFGLTMLGATGVEDQLQDGVEQTLNRLREAGIKVNNVN